MKSLAAPLEVTCPQCGKKFTTSYPLYLDVESDPNTKTLILSSSITIIRCPYCGAKIKANLPFVYHDREKELLIDYVPEALISQKNELDHFFGETTRMLMDSLPPSQRKGYLLRPKEVFSLESLRREILHADGVSDEEIEEQKEDARIMEELFDARGNEEKVRETVEKNEERLTPEFMRLFEILLLTTQENAKKNEISEEGRKDLESFQAVHQWILDNTEIGKVIKEKDQAFEDISATDDYSEMAEAVDRIPVEFMDMLAIILFQKLTDDEFEEFTAAFAKRIVETDKKDPAKAELLRKKRNALLGAFRQFEEDTRKDLRAGVELLDEIMSAPDTERAIMQHASEIDERFIEAWDQAIGHAIASRNKKAYDKLIQIKETYANVTEESVPPYMLLLYRLADASYPEGVQRALEENKDDITPQFFEMLKKLREEAKDEEKKKFWGDVYAMAALMA